MSDREGGAGPVRARRVRGWPGLRWWCRRSVERRSVVDEMEVAVSHPEDDLVRAEIPRQVIVPLDGSDTGARALPLAHAFAGRTGAEVVTVHVGDGSHRDVRVDVELHGEPAAALLAFAQEGPGRVLCLSSHGRSGLRRALVGSVAEKVVRASPGPVIVVGPEVVIKPPVVLPRTIVVAVRSASHGVEVLAERWAPLLGAKVDRVHISVDGSEAPEGARTLPGDDPAAELLRLADQLEGPLLYAVGAAAPDGSRSGRPVSFRLIREGRGPVLTQARPRAPAVGQTVDARA
jgi:nucleotide-binding universal stress UspA family protein